MTRARLHSWVPLVALLAALAGCKSSTGAGSSDGNRPPTASAGTSATVAPGAQVVLDGSASADPDGDALTFLWSQDSGAKVELADAATAHPSFVAPAAAGTLVFTLVVSDGKASSEPARVTVTVAATNQPPVANAGPDASVTVGALVTLDGSRSRDPEDQPLTFAWTQRAGPAVTLSSTSAAAPTFTAPSSPSTLEFELVVSDGTASSAPDSVTVLVGAAPNQAPVANAGSDRTVAPGDQVTLDGSLSSDPEGAPLTYAWTQKSGPAVALTGATTATPSFTAPARGGALVFELVVKDGTLSSAPDLVTITVPNQPPVANAGADQTVGGAATVTLDGSASTDPEGATLSYAWTQLSGPTVALSSSTAAKPTFTAPAKASTLVFSLTVSDGTLASGADTVTVSVPDQPPVANAGADQTVNASATVTLDGSASADPEGAAVTYAWTQLSGPAVTLSSTTDPKPTFVAPAKAATLVFSLVVKDGALSSSAETVSITVPDQPPVADAGADQTVNASATVTLDGSASSDPEGSPLTFAWTQLSGPAVTLSSSTSATPTFTAPAKGSTLVFSLVVSDGGRSSPADTVTITVPNQPPLANAGADQTVNAAAMVTLDGSASTDPEGASLTFAWTQTSGPAVALSSTTASKPTFTSPAKAATLVFSLTVSDGMLTSSADTVTITVPDQPPVANAGPDQTVNASATVTLDGSGSSDPEGATLSFLWTQLSGPAVTLSSATAAKPTFTAPAKGSTLVFSLTVSDGARSSTADTVTITVPNQPPVANAGPDQSVAASSTVTLDATASADPEGASLTYAWTQTSGPTATLSSSTAANPTFTAPASQATLTFSLTVSDGSLTSAADSVVVSIGNQKPLANAGPDQTVAAGATVTLDGRGSSDPEGATLTYAWTQLSGPAATLSSASAAQPTFTAPAAAATLVFSLTVSDGTLTSAADTVSITVPNQKPTASAGPNLTVTPGATVQLDGSGSQDPEGATLSFSWTQTAGTPVTLSSTTAPKPTFTAPGGAATLTFQLVVSDGALSSSPSTVTVTVDPNVPPVANAGPDDVAFAFEDVTLDGTKSTDEQGAALSFTWTQTAGPTATFSDLHAAKPVVTLPDVGADTPLTFSLVVNDGKYDSSPDTVTVTALKYGGARATFKTPPTMRSVGTVGAGDLEIAGSYAYASAGNSGLRVYDLTDPLQPVDVGGISGFGTGYVYANWLLASGNTLYATDLYNLFVIDITNRAAPVRVGMWPAPNSSTYNMRMALVGSYLYSAASTNGLRVLNVSNPAAPTQTTLLTFSGTPAQYPNDVAVAGTTAYVSTGSGNIVRFVDVTNPAAPVALSGGISVTNPVGVEADAATNRLYVLTYGGLQVFDITNRTAPVYLSSFAYGFGYIGTVRGTRNIRLNGARLYMTDDYLRVHVLDVSGTTPVLLGSYSGVNGVSVGNGLGNAVYLTGGVLPGLTVIDSSLPSPAILSTRGLGIASESVRLGSSVYVGYTNGLVTFNVTDPANPTQTNAQQISGSSWNNSLRSDGKYLYAANGGAFQILGLTTPAVPNRLGSVSFSFSSTTDIALAPNRAYVGASGSSSKVVSAIDLTNPSAPTIAGTFTAADYPACLAASGDTVLMGTSAGIRVLDFSTVTSPKQVGTLASGNFNDLELRPPYAFGATSTGVGVVDFSSPAAPVSVGSLNLPSSIGGKSVRLYGNTAVVASGTSSTGMDGRVELFDLTVPAKPAWVGSMDTIGASHVTMDPDGTLYVSQRDSTIGAFRIVKAGSTSLTSGAATLVSLPAGVRRYTVRFTDLYPASDEQVSCIVSGGSCSVVSVDQTAHTAAVDWTMPTVAGDFEISIASGNHHYFAAATDRVRVK